jgi:phage tail-like protein
MAIVKKDPYRSFSFLVEIDGITQAGFQECSGLDSSTGSIDYREGDDGRAPRKIAGMNTFSPISLKRGITDSDELWKWRKTVADGKAERRNGSVVLLDEKGEAKIRWSFRNAWPSKWTGPAFNASGNAIAIESLEITHEELVRE